MPPIVSFSAISMLILFLSLLITRLTSHSLTPHDPLIYFIIVLTSFYSTRDNQFPHSFIHFTDKLYQPSFIWISSCQQTVYFQEERIKAPLNTKLVIYQDFSSDISKEVICLLSFIVCYVFCFPAAPKHIRRKLLLLPHLVEKKEREC